MGSILWHWRWASLWQPVCDSHMHVTLLGWQPIPWLAFSAYATSLPWSTMIKVWTLLPPFSFFSHVSSCSPPPDFYKTQINTMLGFIMWMDRALTLEWNDFIHMLIHQFNYCAITPGHIPIQFQIQATQFHINSTMCPIQSNSKQFHLVNVYAIYFTVLHHTTIISSSFQLVSPAPFAYLYT